DLSAGGEGRARQEIAGLRAVNVSLEGLLVVEPFDEEEPGSEVVERVENLAQLHAGAFPLRPPLPSVESVAGEEDGRADRGVAARFGLRARGLRLGPAGDERLHPRESHAHADPAEHITTRNDW